MQGKKREQSEGRKLYTGFAKSEVIDICPDNDGLKALGFNVPEDKENPIYTGEKDGVETVRLDFWMQETRTQHIYKRSFFLENKGMESKAKEGAEPKLQFVNQTGGSFYAETKEGLPEWFTEFQKNKSKTDKTKVNYGSKTIRQAKVGEADLLDFVRKWLNEMDFYDADTTILLDMKKLFNGDFSELTSMVDSEFAALVIDPLGVNTTKEGKQYQEVYKTALPGWEMNVINNTNFSPENIEKWRKEKKSKDNPNGRYLKDYEQLACDISDSAYPWKAEFELGTFKEFDPETSFVAGGVVTEGVEDDNDKY